MISQRLLLLLLALSLLGCNVTQPSPTLLPTPTPYVPFLKGTPLPLVYETITSKTAASVTLLAYWKANGPTGRRIAFTPDGNLLLVGRVYSGAQIWHVIDGRLDDQLTGQYPFTFTHDGPRQAYSPDGRFVATVDTRGHLYIDSLAPPTNSLYYDLGSGGPGTAVSVAFFLNGQFIAVAKLDGQVWFVPAVNWEPRLLELEGRHSYYDDTLQPKLVIETNKTPWEIDFSPDDSIMALTFDDHTTQLWRVAELSHYKTLESPSEPTSLAFTSNGAVLAIGSTDNLIRLWDTQTGQLLAELRAYQQNSRALADADALVFDPFNRLLISLDDEDGLYIWGNLPSSLLTAAEKTTAIARLAPSSTRTPISLPAPTSTRTNALPAYETLLPLPWPVSVPTDEQIIEARTCEVESLAKTRYPPELKLWQLATAHRPESACDWAALAVAYPINFDSSIPEEGKRAFFQAFKLNPAFALTHPLIYYYFNSLDLVAAPPATQRPLQAVRIDYQWHGLGEPADINYQIEITNAYLSTDKMQIVVKAHPPEMARELNSAIDPFIVHTLAAALVDFLPIQSPFTFNYCTDNSPNWDIKLTYPDNSTVQLNTHRSNLFTPGGPWQIQINGQHYLQFSTDLLKAVVNLFDLMGLPLGQPMGMYCNAMDVFDLAYPK